MGKRIVIALGGNALGSNLPEQMIAVKQTAKAIVDLIEEGHEVIIAHGNGPQVGMIQKAMAELTRAEPEKYIPCPLSVCVAMSQGYIGYDLQNAIRTELIRRGIYKPVASILTQVMVNPYDEAFYTPAKAIGRYMSAEDAKAEEDKGNFVEEVPGKGYRRVVASPKPVSIVEGDVIKAVLDADQIVIACGGGGIPVMEQGYRLKGASAVIEKDLAAGLLAKEVDADVLLILTDVPNVYVNYGKEDQKALETLSVQEAEELMAEGQFEAATMLPKIEAALDFVTHGNHRKAVITSLEKAQDSMAKKAGTVIQ